MVGPSRSVVIRSNSRNVVTAPAGICYLPALPDELFKLSFGHTHMKRPEIAPADASSTRPESPELPAASRRAFLGMAAKAVGALVAAPFVARSLRAQSDATPFDSADNSLPARVARSSAVAVTVYKDPNCGCCKEWIKHMQKAGFTVTSTDSADMKAIKAKYGVPAALQSCHTAVVGDYVVEGHAPADVVQKMLTEKPSARGIAVPGMPQGSPGMEGPTKDKYNVMLFDRLGKATVYASR